jgi:hypothetical protein
MTLHHPAPGIKRNRLTDLFAIHTQWTNMPAAAAEFAGRATHRIRADLTAFTQFRLWARLVPVGAAGAILTPEYSISGGAGPWVKFDGNTGPPLAVNTSDPITPWTDLDDGAKAEDVILRLVGSGGDGVIDPLFTVGIEFW